MTSEQIIEKKIAEIDKIIDLFDNEDIEGVFKWNCVKDTLNEVLTAIKGTPNINDFIQQLEYLIEKWKNSLNF